MMKRPTLSGRAGLDLSGYGPGISEPFGTPRGNSIHHGQDYFWLGPESAALYGISTAASKNVFPVVDGAVHYVSSSALGLGAWQQITSRHRAYSWHLASRSLSDGATGDTEHRLGVMGATGTAAGGEVHLHFEVREAPYQPENRIDPAPFFSGTAGGGTIIKERRRIMANLFYKQGTKPTLYAFAGDSPGTPANWHETTDVGLATQWSALLGIPSILLNAETWDLYKRNYLAPLAVTGVGELNGGSVVFDDATIAKLAAANAQAFFIEQKKAGN